MSYLLRLRRWLRFHPYFAVVFGGGLFVVSAAAAIFGKFSYFYSSFVVGLFLFFDAAAHLLDRSLAFTSNLEKAGRTFWAVLAGFIILTDLIGGQIVFTVWQYPPYKGIVNWILLYLIIYPVGGLSLIAMYRFFDLLFGRLFPGRLFSISLAEVWTKKILKAIFVLLPLVVAVPALIYWGGAMSLVAGQWLVYLLLFLFLFAEWTFFFDVLILAFGGRPLLQDFLEGSKRVILAIVTTGLLGAFLHEVINTYVHEWVYLAENFPVTTATFWGVPVMVFIAWIPLAMVCIQAYRFAQVVRDGGFFRTVFNEYFPPATFGRRGRGRFW